MDNKYDQLFSELEDLRDTVLPPKLEALYTRAHEYEAMLADAAAEGQTGVQFDSLVEQCIADLDEDCPFNDQVVTVTGSLRRSYYDEISGRFVEGPVAVDQEPLISRGFYLVTTETDGVPSYTIGHYFELPDGVERHQDTSIPFADVMMRHYAFAPAGSVDIQYERTTEERLAALEKAIPDTLAEFDGIVMNSADECDAIRQLRHMKFNTHDDVPGEVVIEFLKYANSCLEFDLAVPYVFDVQGLIKPDTETAGQSDESMVDFLYLRDGPMRLVGYVTGLMIDTVVDKRDGRIVESDDQYWHAIVQVLPETLGGEPVSLAVPARAIRSMTSLRRSVYGS